MTQHEIGRIAMRAHMILLSARGCSAYDIAEIHNVTDPTVYKWMERFDQEGPEGLFDYPREGRPPRIDDEAEDEIQRVLQAPPTEEGYDASRWTARRLAEHLQEELGIEVHPETVRRALDRPGPPAVREEPAPEVLAVVEVMPQMIGGMVRLAAAVEYPEAAHRAGIEGTVVVRIVVDEEGRPTSPSVLRSPAAVLEEAALEAVMQQRFPPGRQRSRRVKVEMTIPVRIQLARR